MTKLLQVGATAVLTLQAGCMSYSYVDGNNIRHVVGLVDMSIAQTSDPAAATAISLSGLGFAVRSDPSGSSVSLGYSRETVMILPANACVDLNAAGPCAVAAKADTGGTGHDHP